MSEEIRENKYVDYVDPYVDCGEECEDEIKEKFHVTGRRNHFAVINNIIKDLGGLAFACKVLPDGLRLLKKLDRKKRFHKIIDGCSEAIPTCLLGHQIYKSVKEFYKTEPETLYNKEFKIKQHILSTELEIYEYEFDVGKEVIMWLVKSKTDNFKVVAIYNSEFESINGIKFEKDDTIYIHFKYKNHSFLVSVVYCVFGKNVILKDCGIIISEETRKRIPPTLVQCDMMKEFVSNFSINNNVIYYTSNGLESKKKEKIKYSINQIDTNELVEEIENSIEINKKRAIVFSGPAGTGKTSILQKIENDMEKIPFIHVSPNTFHYVEDVYTFFKFARSVGPCIIVFDDWDANESMESKNNRMVGAFLEEIDAIKDDNKGIIILACVNDTSLINSTIINRRGRFDRVVFIGPPKSEKEIYDVMEARFHTEKPNNEFIKQTDIKRKFYKTVIKNNLTQSDICEIIDSLIIMKKKITNDNLMNSLNSLLETHEAIKKSYSNTEN